MADSQDEMGVILKNARARAKATGYEAIDTDHLLLAILSGPDPTFANQLRKYVSIPEIPNVAWHHTLGNLRNITPNAERAISRAVSDFHLRWKHRRFSGLHLFAGLLEQQDPKDKALILLRSWGANLLVLRRQVDFWLKLHPPDAKLSVSAEEDSVPSREASEPSLLVLKPETEEAQAGQLSDWFDTDTLRLIGSAKGSYGDLPNAIGVPDLLRAMQVAPDSIAGRALSSIGELAIKDSATRTLSRTQSGQLFSDDVQKVLKIAFDEARSSGKRKVDSGHLLVAIAKAIIENEITTSFDSESSIQDIAKFREHVFAIRSAFERESAPEQRTSESVEAPAKPTEFRVIDLEKVCILPEEFSAIPCDSSIRLILMRAVEEAIFLRHQKLNYAHIAIGLIHVAETVHAKIFVERKREFDTLIKAFAKLSCEINEKIETDRTVSTLQIAWNVAQQFRANRVEFNHLTLALIVVGGDEFKSAWESASSTSLKGLRRQLESCSVTLAAQHSMLVPEDFIGEERLEEIFTSASSSKEHLFPRVVGLQKLASFLTPNSKKVMDLAEVYARSAQQSTIDVEVLILALGTLKESVCWTALQSCNFNVHDPGQFLLKRGDSRATSVMRLSMNCRTMLCDAKEIARSKGRRLMDPEDILWALINECEGYAKLAFQILNLNAEDLALALDEAIIENESH